MAGVSKQPSGCIETFLDVSDFSVQLLDGVHASMRSCAVYVQHPRSSAEHNHILDVASKMLQILDVASQMLSWAFQM